MPKPLFSGWKRLDGPEFHVIIAVLVIGLVWVFAPSWAMYLVIAVNTVGWVAYECIQGAVMGKGANPFSSRWGWRKRSEMLAPVAAGWTMLFMWLGTQ